MANNKMIINAVSAVLALGLTSSHADLAENKSSVSMQNTNIPGMEQCFGIAKKGMNDCATASHNCSGEAKMDGDKKEWLYLPTGLCNKIVGASLKPSNKS